MKKLVTADLHLGHTRAIEYNNRPFPSLLEMDIALIKNWNAVVCPEDTIYVLGDFTLRDWKDAIVYFGLLNGHIKVLDTPGHHDARWIKYYHKHPERFVSASGHDVEILPPYVELKLPEYGCGKWAQYVSLFHFPIRNWSRRHYGSWHLHGHSHGRVQWENYELALDVGVDCHNYAPITFDAVADHMLNKEDFRHDR